MRKVGDSHAVAPATTNVPTPPETTAGTSPINFANAPDSNAPISLDEMMNILFTDDTLGETRELVSDPLAATYLDAFRDIDADPRHRLIARLRGCRLVQLTTNNGRTDAQRFYERLGFRATHVGMKLDLTQS